MSKKRGGLSTGSWAMLIITLTVILGCVLLFPKLTGNVDVRVSPDEIAKALSDNIKGVTQAMSSGASAPSVLSSSSTALPSGKTDYSSASQAEQAVVVTATPAAPAAPTPEPKRSFTLTASGLLSIERTMQRAMLTDKANRFSELLKYVSSDLTGDLVLATLKHTAVSSEDTSDINLPVGILPELRSSGINALCVGFGGALNFGLSGAQTTLDTLRQMGFTAYGTYPTQQARSTLSLINLRGVSVALLSYSDELSNAAKKKTTADERAFAFPAVNIEEITADILAAKAQGAQVILVSLCWGKESATSPTKAQIALAQDIAKAGADIILGTNSQAVQSIALLSSVREDGLTHQTLCAYSLGTLATSSREKRVELSGLLLHATVEYDPQTGLCAFPALTYTPTYVWRAKEDGANVYRVVPSDQPQPDSMDKEQKGVMDRCLSVIEKVMTDSPVTKR